MSTDWRDYLKPVTYVNWVQKSMETERGRQMVFGVGGVVGAIVIVVAGYLIYVQIVGIPAPDVKNAPVEKITTFFGNPQGFARLPVPKRQEYMIEVMKTYSDPGKREQLARSMQRMTTDEKVTLRDSLFDVGYKVFTEEVEQYYSTPEKDRFEFVDRKIYDYAQARKHLLGEQKTRTGEQAMVDSTWAAGLPTDSDGIVKLLITKTRPEDRARMKPYVESIRTRMDELKKNPGEAERLVKKFQNMKR
jgi:hypothetical protein